MDTLDKRLLNDFQRDFPLTPRPFAELGVQLGISEETVIQTLTRLKETGKISRVGPVFAPGRLSVSTLAAMAVPPERLETVAALINEYPEVNHNYEREHCFNLWFVTIAPDQTRLRTVLDEISERTGLSVMSLPLITDYHIDLGFSLDL